MLDRAPGRLRIYLGAAPGVGKTYAMLNEGRRRHDRGTDVVVGFVEAYGRPRTIEQLGDLETVPPRRIEDGGVTEELDIDAVLARHPQVVLIDELAHANAPGGRNAKRWQDVEELLAAGIEVISTLNIQHLESIADVVERITGVRQQETIPDDVVRRAEQIELVDMTPEAVRRRMAHGNIYPAEKIDAALASYFRPGNLTALRELALLWVADRVDDSLAEYRGRLGISEQWETRERVLVALTGAPGSEDLIRRAARMVQRTHGGLIGVHVQPEANLADTAVDLEEHRKLLADLGGEYHAIVGSDVATALVEFARAENCTQLVLGASGRSRAAVLLRGSIINRVIRLSGPIDVHVISHEPDETARRLPIPRHRRAVAPSRPRQLAGWAIAVAGVPLLTLVLANLRESVDLPGILLLYLLLTVTAAAIGGLLPALATALTGFLCANWYFTPPFHTWTIAEGKHLLALIVFLIVAGVVSSLVSIAARRAAEASRAAAEAESLARLSATITAEDPLGVLVGHLRSTFGLSAVAVLRHRDGEWLVEASAGSPAPVHPDMADAIEPLGEHVVLAINGRGLSGNDRRVLNAFSAQLAAALERSKLSAAAAEAGALTQANELRTALLQAVSHDLRTPLASVKASVSSLRQHDIDWTPGEEEEFLATIEEETDRLTTLVANLLDMSRLQAGVIQPALRPVGLEEVVPAALASLGDGARSVRVEVPESLPEVLTDPVLLERVVANLVGNAINWSPPGRFVTVTAGAVADHVDLRIVDRGPGIAPGARERVFEPFQRLGDNLRHSGVGLGLAVARGFTDATGGELTLDDTPGGGTTATVTLPVAP